MEGKMANGPLLFSPRYAEYQYIWGIIASMLAELEYDQQQGQVTDVDLEVLDVLLCEADAFLKELLVCFWNIAPLSIGESTPITIGSGAGPGPGIKCDATNSVAPSP
jgi:hypothetical protein